MAEYLLGPVGGGLSAADRAKLVPENIRKGVVLFEGTPREVVGSLDMEFLGSGFRYNAWQSYNVGDTLQNANDYLEPVTVPSGAGQRSSFKAKAPCDVVIFWKGQAQAGTVTTMAADGVPVVSGEAIHLETGSTIQLSLGAFGGSLASIYFVIFKV